jgi:hypothetical protein
MSAGADGFVWLDDFLIQPPATSWLVRDYLELDSLAALFGDSEAGKSFLAIDLACHIAHGLAWRGHAVKQGRVLYIAGEGQSGLRRRFLAWHIRHGLTPGKQVAVRTVPTALCEASAVQKLIDLIRDLVAQIGEQPVLIVLDTLNRNFGNGNENDTKDMTAFVAGLDALRGATGACVAVIHHCGHADKTRMRAAISLHNAVDAEYLVARDGNREEITTLITTLKNTKTKEGLIPPPLAWRWEQQALPWADQDDHGFVVPQNSAVLIPTDYVSPKRTRIGNREQQAVDAYDRLLLECQANLVAGGHDGKTAMVKFEAWLGVVKTIEPDRSNRAKLVKAIQDKGLLEISDGYVRRG